MLLCLRFDAIGTYGDGVLATVDERIRNLRASETLRPRPRLGEWPSAEHQAENLAKKQDEKLSLLVIRARDLCLYGHDLRLESLMVHQMGLVAAGRDRRSDVGDGVK